MRRALIVVALVLTFFARDARAQLPVNLDLAQVSSNVTCNFDQDCVVTADDWTMHFTIPGAFGTAALHSRMWPPGEPGTEGAGLHPYVYRLDLSGMPLRRSPCVTAVGIEFGPVSPLDYEEDGDLDDAWVMTSGGIGMIAPTRVVMTYPRVTFHFDTPVCSGQTSFFFGLMSQWGFSGGVEARIAYSGGTLIVPTRSPWNLIR